jgi:hypothetical protein
VDDPVYTYRSILEDSVYYPKFLSNECKDLIGTLPSLHHARPSSSATLQR